MTTQEKDVLLELKEKLRNIHNDNEFVMGVVYNAGGVENWKKVIDFVDIYPRSRSEVIAFAIFLQEGVEIPYKSIEGKPS